jgi:hypothetical protein
MTRPFVVFVCFSLFACTHGEPFTGSPGDSLGPFTPGLPRQLTFNPGRDVTASAIGDSVVFSRNEEARTDGDYCLALLPLEGGQLYANRCAGGLASDTVQDVWTFPVISPDRGRVALVREREVVASGRELGRELVIAPLGNPDSVLVVVTGGYPLNDSTLGNAFRQPTWAGDGMVRFLGGLDQSGPNAVFVPGGVWEVSVGADPAPEPQRIPDLSDAFAFAQREDGSILFLSGSDPSGVYQWTPGAPPSLVTQFGCLDGSAFGGLTGVAPAPGGVAALVTCVYEGGSAQVQLHWTPTGGTQRAVSLRFMPERIAAVPGQARLIVEAGGDLWLVGIP